jgi:hypothetical protein
VADVNHAKIEEIDAIEGFFEADGETYPIDPEHIVRVGPAVTRKITAGPDGLRLLAIGATAGRPYDPGGTL